MRGVRRQDLLLIAGLVAALIVLFSGPLSQILRYTRQVEQQSGLSLAAALILLVTVVLHLVGRREELRVAAMAADAAKQSAEERARELERLVAFGHALARSLDRDAIRTAVAQHLPRVAGTDSVWVLLQTGSEWEVLLGNAVHGDEDHGARIAFASQLLNGAQPAGVEEVSAGFPLMVGGTAIGVLGVQLPAGGLDGDRRRAIEAAAALLAVSLKNADLFREVREHSLRDPLTGCFTRPHAMDVIDAELRRARRSQLPVSLVMFDLDHFKDVNDRYGHLCGDTVLSTVGKRMRDVLRGSDLKCRYGGEEFLVLLPETPLHGARRVAETLRKEIGDRPIPWAGDALTITASFGITQALPGEVNIQAIIGRADAALYRAKDEGRNCVRVASDTLSVVRDLRPRDSKGF